LLANTLTKAQAHELGCALYKIMASRYEGLINQLRCILIAASERVKMAEAAMIAFALAASAVVYAAARVVDAVDDSPTERMIEGSIRRLRLI
jgi:hypothetical protein